MLRKLSQEVSDCYAHAEEAGRKAKETSSEELRKDYLRAQQSWLTLAHGYEFAERLLDFSKENERRRAEFYGSDWRDARPPQPGTPRPGFIEPIRQYTFIICSGQQVCGPPRAVEVPGGDQAALNYACDLVRQLKKSAGYDDPGLMVLVRDERGPIFTIPFLAACA
jgi:hypothetical protein